MLGIGVDCGGGDAWRAAGGRELKSGVAIGRGCRGWENIWAVEM